jgi:hypothetical protein
MDLAIMLLRDASFWPGGRPTTREDHFKRFCLQLGVSAAAFATNPKKRRKHVSLASKAGPRPMSEDKDIVPVTALFDARFRWEGGQGRWDLTPETVDEIIKKSDWAQTGNEEEGTLMMERLDLNTNTTKEKNGKGAGKGKGKGQANARGTPLLSPEQLIRSLTLTLISEAVAHAFPWLILHRAVWTLFRRVRQECDTVLRELYTSAYMERESELPWVVGYAFMAASGMGSGRQDDRLLEGAATVLRRWVEEGEGEVCIRGMRGVGMRVLFLEEEEEDGDIGE